MDAGVFDGFQDRLGNPHGIVANDGAKELAGLDRGGPADGSLLDPGCAAAVLLGDESDAQHEQRIQAAFKDGVGHKGDNIAGSWDQRADGSAKKRRQGGLQLFGDQVEIVDLAGQQNRAKNIGVELDQVADRRALMVEHGNLPDELEGGDEDKQAVE